MPIHNVVISRCFTHLKKRKAVRNRFYATTELALDNSGKEKPPVNRQKPRAEPDSTDSHQMGGKSSPTHSIILDYYERGYDQVCFRIH